MIRQVIHTWERRLSQRDLNRMMIPFEWGLEFLDGDAATADALAEAESSNGHNSDPRKIVFDFNERAIADSDRFFGPPSAVTDFSFDGHWLSFSSQVRTPYENNNTARARYFAVPQPDGGVNGSRALEVE